MEDTNTLEKRELESLNGMGVAFTLNYTTHGLFGKAHQRTKKYVLREFTLATLNLMSLQSLNVKINEAEEGEALSRIESARKEAISNVEPMARIVAYAILGERYWWRIPGTCRRIVRRRGNRTPTSTISMSISLRTLMRCTML